jgi:hypothetical protein
MRAEDDTIAGFQGNQGLENDRRSGVGSRDNSRHNAYRDAVLDDLLPRDLTQQADQVHRAYFELVRPRKVEESFHDAVQTRNFPLDYAELGVDEVCFGDTIGVGVPSQVAALTELAVDAGIPLERIAFHFHDTRGTALANVAAGLDAGVRCFDSAAGGTGGCPYAPGAAGNLATEDLVYFLDASGWEHGASLDGILAAARFIADALGRPLATKVGQAGGWDPGSGAAIGRPRPRPEASFGSFEPSGMTDPVEGA